MRCLLRLGICLVLLGISSVFAQGRSTIGFLPGAGECNNPSSVFCLQPSATLRVGLNRIGSIQDDISWDLASAFGIGLAARGDLGRLDALGLEGFSYKVSGAVWSDSVWSLDLLEAYAEVPLDTFRLSVGKRTRYSGPWDDVLVGRLGRWGLYVDAVRKDELAPVPLGFEGAYLPNPGFAGGLIFLGVSYGIFHAGSFVDVIENPTTSESSGFSVVITPRVGIESDLATLYWQQDRGFWTSLRVPIGQTVSLISQSTGGAGVLDQISLEALVWWNPNGDLLKSSTYIPPDEDRNLYWLNNPQKFLAGVAINWQDLFKIGVDISRAPVEAFRVYSQLWLR